MTHDPHSQIDLDILAFVNGQLDSERRFAVLQYLAQHPNMAAEVMADLRLTEGLRLAVGSVETPAPLSLTKEAARLSAAISQQTTRRRWMPFAASVALFALGWGAHSTLQGHGPEKGMGSGYADVLNTALDAQDAVMLRASLTDELGPMQNDPQRIAARLGIELPNLPQDWIIRAAQVVATPERPGIALMIDTPDMGEILLFGVMLSVDGPDGPAAATSRDGRALAFFEKEQTAFVLVDATGSPSQLRAGAESLRNRFN